LNRPFIGMMDQAGTPFAAAIGRMSDGSAAYDPVLKALAGDSATEFGAPGAEIDVLRQIDGPYSSVRRVRIKTPAGTRHAYIKVLHPRGPGPEEEARADRFIKREFDATSALHRALQQDAGIAAVRPLAFLPQHRALVTEEVPGRPFGDLLDDPSQPAAFLERIASRVGTWVHAYQKAVDAGGEIALEERRAYLDDRLRMLEGRVFAAADRRGVLAQFDALRSEIGAAAVPAVAIHADLTPMNIVVDQSGRVAVIDFTMAKTGTEHHDVSHMYFHLELLAAKHRDRRGAIAALQQAMLSGYRAGLTTGDPLFQLMLLQHGVCHVAMLAERRFGVVDIAYRWFLRRRWHMCQEIHRRLPTAQVA
jgi:hypothetical protein